MMSEQLYHEIGQQLANEHGTTMGNLFGKPCLKVNNKAFAAFFKGAMVFKIGQEEANLLKEKYQGSQNWDPSGKKRPMKDWLEVPVEFSADWNSLANKALKYMQ